MLIQPVSGHIVWLRCAGVWCHTIGNSSSSVGGFWCQTRGQRLQWSRLRLLSSRLNDYLLSTSLWYTLDFETGKRWNRCLKHVMSCLNFYYYYYYGRQESPADAVKPTRRKSMPKLLQFDVFRFISPNSISPNCQCIASRGRPTFSQALGLYSCTQFEIRCLPIIKFLVQIAST